MSYFKGKKYIWTYIDYAWAEHDLENWNCNTIKIKGLLRGQKIHDRLNTQGIDLIQI